MYERFTDRARKVMQLANQEAQRFNHEYIGTEHILLGLIKEGSGVAANVLKNLDVDAFVAELRARMLDELDYEPADMADLLENPVTDRPPWTVFKSVGIASQDVAAALAALEQARSASPLAGTQTSSRTRG